MTEFIPRSPEQLTSLTIKTIDDNGSMPQPIELASTYSISELYDEVSELRNQEKKLMFSDKPEDLKKLRFLKETFVEAIHLAQDKGLE